MRRIDTSAVAPDIHSFQFMRSGVELLAAYNGDPCTVPEAVIAVLRLAGPELVRAAGLAKENEQIEFGGVVQAAEVGAPHPAAMMDEIEALERSRPNFAPAGRVRR